MDNDFYKDFFRKIFMKIFVVCEGLNAAVNLNKSLINCIYINQDTIFNYIRVEGSKNKYLPWEP